MIPLAVAPIVLWRLLRSGARAAERGRRSPRSSSPRTRSGSSSSPRSRARPWGYDRLHDRYAFYLLPLWLIVLVVWLADGLPRPLVATAIGVGLALVLPAVLPFRQLANEAGIDTVPARSGSGSRRRSPGRALVGRRLLAVFVVGLLVAAGAPPAPA